MSIYSLSKVATKKPPLRSARRVAEEIYRLAFAPKLRLPITGGLLSVREGFRSISLVYPKR